LEGANLMPFSNGFRRFQAKVCYTYKFTIFNIREGVAMAVSHAADSDYTYTYHGNLLYSLN
jgi:hypothetical protein